MRERKLSALKHRSPEERRRCKIVSKIKLALIEHGRFEPSKKGLPVTFFFFPRTFFLALGLVGAVLLGSLQACAIYIPAAPDVQGNRAKSKPLLLRGGLGHGWRWGGGVASASTSLVSGWLPSVTVLATQSNSRRLAA